MKRPSAARRGYTSQWQKAREGYIAKHPTCVLCHQQVKLHSHPGDPLLGVVDHRVPHRGDPRLFWDSGNWQTMHKGCHDSAKQSHEKSGKGMVARGCDSEGMPLDRGHHWRRG